VWHHCDLCLYDMSYVKIEDAVFGLFHQEHCIGQGKCVESPEP
jgi:hypothetical protein